MEAPLSTSGSTIGFMPTQEGQLNYRRILDILYPCFNSCTLIIYSISIAMESNVIIKTSGGCYEVVESFTDLELSAFNPAGLIFFLHVLQQF